MFFCFFIKLLKLPKSIVQFLYNITSSQCNFWHDLLRLGKKLTVFTQMQAPEPFSVSAANIYMEKSGNFCVTMVLPNLKGE